MPIDGCLACGTAPLFAQSPCASQLPRSHCPCSASLPVLTSTRICMRHQLNLCCRTCSACGSRYGSQYELKFHDTGIERQTTYPLVILRAFWVARYIILMRPRGHLLIVIFGATFFFACGPRGLLTLHQIQRKSTPWLRTQACY